MQAAHVKPTLPTKAVESRSARNSDAIRLQRPTRPRSAISIQRSTRTSTSSLHRFIRRRSVRDDDVHAVVARRALRSKFTVTRRGSIHLITNSSSSHGSLVATVGGVGRHVAFARFAIAAMSRLLPREEIVRLKHDPLKVKVSLKRKSEEAEEERKARRKKRRRELKESSQLDTRQTATTTHASHEDTTKKRAETGDEVRKDRGGEETVAGGGPQGGSGGLKLKQMASTVWDEPVFLERVGVWAGPFVVSGD